jgi:hypothetical protein
MLAPKPAVVPPEDAGGRSSESGEWLGMARAVAKRTQPRADQPLPFTVREEMPAKKTLIMRMTSSAMPVFAPQAAK